MAAKNGILELDVPDAYRSSTGDDMIATHCVR